jgi:Mrp family chromosome partitioning ATPase
VERLQRAHELPPLSWAGAAAAAPHETVDAVQERAGADDRRDSGRVNIDRSLFKDRPIVMPDDSGPAAHAYRMLRTQLLQRVRQHGVRTVGIVSAADLEGKTLTAVNLALSLAAEPNQRVLLVDLDLHRPSVATMLKLQVARGLESWLDGSIASVGEIIYGVDSFERLLILPTLTEVPGSSEILAGERAQRMLYELKTADADRLVVFDLPPLLLTDDFLTIAAHLDGVVVVAREGHTKRDDLHRMREMLGSALVLGTVLTHSTQFERRAY